MTAPAPEARIAPATPNDVPTILRLIKGLAEFEALTAEVTATEEQLHESLFGPDPAAEVLLAYADSEAVGFAVFFSSYSTFLSRRGLYLEDVFVLPEWRKRGYGRQLLARVASIAVERGCGRMEWAVLDWNAPALRFYESFGAEPMDQWTTYRITGAALERLAAIDEGL